MSLSSVHRTAVERGSSLYTASAVDVEGVPIVPAGKLISGAYKCKDLLIFQSGLPGNAMGMAETKARELVARRPGSSVLITLPEGLELEQDLVNLGTKNVDIEKAHADFFSQFFGLQKFVRQLFAAFQVARDHVSPDCRIHLAGHSYGATAVLYALSRCEKDGVPFPASAHFLAPFVKICLDADDPALTLSIVNAAVAGVLEKSPDEQTADLGKLLEMCRSSYKIDPGISLLEEHRAVFGSAFLNATRLPRQRDDACVYKVIVGEHDPYVGRAHVDLLKKQLGRPCNVTSFPNDTHDLESLSFEDLIGG